jgi:cyanophycin synthetase
MRIEQRRFLPACAGGLSEKTAFVDVVIPGLIVWDPKVDNRLRTGASALNRAEPLYRVADSDWPGAFVVTDAEPAGDRALLRLGEWVVALTVAIQRWGRDPVRRGRVLSAAHGRVCLAMPWYRADFFDEALEHAVRLISRWSASGADSDALAAEGLDGVFGGRWAEIRAGGLGPETLRFLDIALHRGLPFDVLPAFVQIGWGRQAQRFDFTCTGNTSALAAAVAKNKLKTLQTLEEAGLPIPQAAVVTTTEQALRAAEDIGWPVVVKPLLGDGGAGVATAIRDPERLIQAWEFAYGTGLGNVLLEKHCDGDDHRLLVAGGTVLQVARRTPAHVVGDGAHTVRALVARVNADPRRGTQARSPLQVMAIDDDAIDYLCEQDLQPESVPEAGRVVRLSRIANISAGGTADDVTASVHPDNIALAERAARIIGLDVAGIDFLCTDITRSWRDVGGVICEVNAQPGLRPHWLADPSRDIAAEIFDIVVGDRPVRVPTAAITGTNGKTTTTEMLARIWTAAGKLTGVCTTARLRIGTETVSTRNYSGQPGARIILNDTAVEAAVLEMPRHSFLFSGHPCDRYDVAALLNVQDDHVGVDGIDTIEQLAELKAEVLERATEAIVVNAEDPLCLAMRARAGTGRHILVARTPGAPAIAEHRRQGGEAVFLADRGGRRWIVLATGDDETDVMPVHDIPATMNGLLAFNESNAMFAVALAWAQGIGLGTIREALGSFGNTVEDNPGRYNFIDGMPFDVLVDFAHNPDGVRGICSVVDALPVEGRRLLCSLLFGTRHSTVIDELAPQLASSFDDFVLSCDLVNVDASPDYAGDDPAGAMLARYRKALQQQRVDARRITCEADPETAIRLALDHARPGDLLVVLAGHGDAQRVIGEWRASHSG